MGEKGKSGDQGLWSADDNFRVIVARDHFAEAGPDGALLAGYAGRELHLPRDARLRPAREHLVGHREKRFLDNLRGGGVQRTAPDEKWGDKWGDKWGEKTAATRLRIARAMRRNPRITIVELAAELGVASTSGIEKHLKAMRDVGCIHRAGPAKGGHWEVRL